eukprot:jgi/Bigna1/132559/aug1.18_g7267
MSTTRILQRINNYGFLKTSPRTRPRYLHQEKASTGIFTAIDHKAFETLWALVSQHGDKDRDDQTQTLPGAQYMTPEFREAIFRVPGHELGLKDHGSSQNEAQQTRTKERRIPIELQQLFAKLQTENRETSVKTSDLTDSFGWNENQVRQQHDLSELNMVLLEAIEKSLKNTSGGDLISRTYEIGVSQEVQCKECGNISKRDTVERTLTVDVQGFPSLEDSLKSYLAPEQLTGGNQYRCYCCQKKVDAIKRFRMKKLPPVLTICMNRFSFDWNRNTRIKIGDRFSFPKVLSLEVVEEEEGEEELTGDDQAREAAGSKTKKASKKTVYDLLSVVLHSGSANSGHYHAYIRDMHHEVAHSLSSPPSSSKRGRKSSVSPRPKREQKHQQHQLHSKMSEDDKASRLQALALMIQAVFRTSRIQALGMEFKRQAGESWSRSYGKRHGKMLDFCRANPDFFRIMNHETVQLASDKDTLTAMVCSLSTTKEEKEREEKTHDGCEVKTKEAEEKASPCSSTSAPPSEDQSCSNPADDGDALKQSVKSGESYGGWFDFNDSKVTPIDVSELEKQYGGDSSSGGGGGRKKRGKQPRRDECAYILVYRKRSTLGIVRRAEGVNDKEREEKGSAANGSVSKPDDVNKTKKRVALQPLAPALPQLPDWYLQKERQQKEREEDLWLAITFLSPTNTDSKEGDDAEAAPRRWGRVKAKKQEKWSTFEPFLLGLGSISLPGVSGKRTASESKHGGSNGGGHIDDIAVYREKRKKNKGRSKFERVCVASEVADGKTLIEMGLEEEDELFVCIRRRSTIATSTKEEEEAWVASELKRRTRDCYELLLHDHLRQHALPDDIPEKYYMEGLNTIGQLRLAMQQGGCFPPLPVGNQRMNQYCQDYGGSRVILGNSNKNDDKSNDGEGDRIEAGEEQFLPDNTPLEFINLKTSKYTLNRVARPQPPRGYLALRVASNVPSSSSSPESSSSKYQHICVPECISPHKLKEQIRGMYGLLKGERNNNNNNKTHEAEGSDDGRLPAQYALRISPTDHDPTAFIANPGEEVKGKSDELSSYQMDQGQRVWLERVKRDDMRITLHLYVPKNSPFRQALVAAEAGEGGGDCSVDEAMEVEDPGDNKHDRSFGEQVVGSAVDMVTGLFESLNITSPKKKQQQEDGKVDNKNSTQDTGDNTGDDDLGEARRPLPGEWRQLGSVIVSRASEVDDIRVTALSLLEKKLKSIKVDTPPAINMRLTFLDDDFLPGRVWKNGSSSIGESGERKVGVIIVPIPDPEHKNWKSRLYGKPYPMIVERVDNKNDTLSDFKERVAAKEAFGNILLENMVLAFYQSRNFTWKLLKGQKNLEWQAATGRRRRKKKKKKSRKRSKGSNKGPVAEILGQCPDHVVIAVADKGDFDGKKPVFQTELDECRQAELKIQTGGKGSGEAGLTISVDFDSSSSEDDED